MFLLTPPRQRHEYDVLPPRLLADLFGEVVTIHSWQSDIEDRDLGLEGRRGAQRLIAIVGGLHLVTEHPQKHRQTVRRIVVIVHHEDSAMGFAMRFFRGVAGGFLSLGCHRQANRELAAHSWAGTVGRNAAAVQLDELIH